MQILLWSLIVVSIIVALISVHRNAILPWFAACGITVILLGVVTGFFSVPSESDDPTIQLSKHYLVNVTRYDPRTQLAEYDTVYHGDHYVCRAHVFDDPRGDGRLLMKGAHNPSRSSMCVLTTD